MKVLKNQTASPIFISDTGISIPASPVTYIIPAQDYDLWAASSDIITVVGNATVKVNDGTFDLSKADAIAMLQGNFKQADFIAALKNNNRLKVEVQNLNGPMIQVSSNDQTTGYLEAKVVAEAGATTVTTLNDGGDEDLQIGLALVGTPGTYGSAAQVPVLTTDTKGRVTGVTNTAITLTPGSITGFDEQAQDAVGNILTDSTSIDFTYNDGANAITAAVLPAGVDHNSLQNYVANRHIDHSAVSITGGTGLTGGGNLTASSAISMPNVGTPNTYGSASAVPVITTDTQGRVSSATNTAIQIAESQVTNLVTDLANKQPLDSDLTAVAGLATTGFISRTGVGTAVTRTMTQSTGLTVANGDGLAGNPTFSITNTGVVAGTYGDSNDIPAVTVNAQGQITTITTVPLVLTATEASSAANATTTSNTDAVLTGMTLTPGAGTYLVLFSTSITVNNAGAAISVSCYANGVQFADTLMKAVPFDGGALSTGSARGAISINKIVTVAAGQAIDIRWSTSGGTATCGPRVLNLLKVS